MPRHGRRGGAAVRAALVALGIAATATLSPGPGLVAAQDDTTLRIEPADVVVAGGQAFDLYVVLESGAATTGVQTDLVFDPALVHVLDVAPGQAYANAVFVYGSADDCSNISVQAAVDRANETGTLRAIATRLPPGRGSVPPGEVIVVRVTMQAQPGPGGSTTVDLRQSTVRGEHRENAPITGTGTRLSIGASVAPSAAGASAAAPSGDAAQPPATASIDPSGPSAAPSDTGASSADPAPAPGSSDDVGSGSPAPGGSPVPADVTLTPDSVRLEPCATAILQMKVRSDVAVSSVAADLGFDQNVVRVTKLEPGPDWSQGAVVAGGSGQTLDEALTQANLTGTLSQAGAFLLPGMPNLPSGESLVLTITMTGRVPGTSNITVSNAVVVDALGGALPVRQAAPLRVEGSPEAGGIDPSMIGGAVAIAVLLGIFLLIRSGTVSRRGLRRWPYIVSLLLALIPVTMFIGLAAMLVLKSLPVLSTPGLPAILSDRFSSNFSLGGAKGEYGLLPAVWGTVEITVIAIGLALPASIAMAIVATEFPMGPLGRLLRPVLGVLSGIPPIVYAVAGAVFVTVFIAPKFAGSADFNAFDPAALGIPAASWPPADVPWNPTSFPWPPNSGGIPSSTLLGGGLIALLVIPFMTPLIFDAMRNVPSAAREASFALGANRGYTLRRAVLPLAMPGIVGALALATLKALGDVLIIALAVGWQAERLPNPIVDVLERTSSLAAEGANLLGNLQAGAGQYCDPKAPSCAVGYTSALVLMAVAAAVVVGASVVEGRLRRRLRA